MPDIQCPSGHALRLKQIKPIQLFYEDEWVYCWSCKQQLKFQKVVANLDCGHVVCHKCQSLNSGTCIMCDSKVQKTLNLQSGGSGFSTHSEV